MYKSSPRVKPVVTEKLIERIKFYLEENKRKRLTGLSKQQKKKKDIYEALLEEGFNVSYTTVLRVANKLEAKAHEAYIRQEYVPGNVVEFDWGTVKIHVNGGALREYQMAVFTSAYSNLRWAKLFPKQDSQCFVESHSDFFEYVGGSFAQVVYDNMRVAVRKFISKTEKEPTEELLRLSLYYRYKFRFCNVRSGNEKGHVERSVEVVRRKAFSKKDTFASLDEANEYLLNVCEGLNNKTTLGKDKEFIRLLDLIGKVGIEKVEKSISIVSNSTPTSVTLDKIEFICQRNNDMEFYKQYFKDKDSEIINNSLHMLSDYANLLSERKGDIS